MKEQTWGLHLYWLGSWNGIVQEAARFPWDSPVAEAAGSYHSGVLAASLAARTETSSCSKWAVLSWPLCNWDWDCHLHTVTTAHKASVREISASSSSNRLISLPFSRMVSQSLFSLTYNIKTATIAKILVYFQCQQSTTFKGKKNRYLDGMIHCDTIKCWIHQTKTITTKTKTKQTREENQTNLKNHNRKCSAKVDCE